MNHHKEQTTATIDISALIAQIMSSESSRRGPAFQQPAIIRDPNLEGTNMGATMTIHRGSLVSSGEVNESCGVNIYVNNNIQGLNNSIMIGSRLHMGDPGVWLSLKDSKLEKWFTKKENSSAGFLSFGFHVLLILVIVLAFTVMYFIGRGRLLGILCLVAVQLGCGDC
ncbi:hypothetical protein HanXRQr2_Chr04g0169981 [Helianthus annuus]|uniref:Uncharacterized protein n=1 Tax=Helianthus annuus TaxID=4232 RepID=A0A9K3J817_HELAN|nr:hypothetical protein HanXRQr2_Chr04g0169981 [Helianthus annuus]KAJ0931588.1 hypothetical protein HanPSC8_Chr04g0163511 [Helianthus annuus]